jgi:hypothetical protein
MRLERLFFVTLLAAFAGQASLQGQSFTGGFSFTLPADDTTSAAFLPRFPARPIGPSDFVGITGGRFSVNGNPIRFWGTNSVAQGAFPDKGSAWFVAGRLRKMGFNLIRFHHLDNAWTESLFESGKDTRHLNPVTLDRLEKYISELKKNGIYINMNLHVSRTFNSRDGVSQADSLPEMGKGVTYFDPQLIELQKEYASQLLGHVNPYTGLALKDDPVMAMVEITNENSIYRMWRDGSLRPVSEGGDFPVRHVQMLDQLWTGYLREKYPDTDSLESAWNQGIILDSRNEQIQDGGFENEPIGRYWQMEQHETARANMALDTSNPYAGARCGRVTVTRSDGTGWHIQWKQVRMTVVKDSLYTVSFAGRSDANRSVSVTVMKDSSPWTGYTSASFLLKPEWQVFEFSFRAVETCSGDTRLSFNLGEAEGDFWFDDIHLTTAAVRGLLSGESLEQGTVKRIAFSECVKFTDNRVRDISAFYLKIMDDYFEEMASHIKGSLGVWVPVVGTNWNVGPADLAAQSGLDYIDNHSYWDHPQFPNIPWSSTDWLINNTAMVLDPNGGTIPGVMAGVGHRDKPFTISEYNHAFPNRYQSEGVLFIAAYSAFHGVDAPMFFDYGGAQTGWETDRVDGYFGIHRNTAMMCLMPSCAFAFRRGLIGPARQTLLLEFSRDDILLLPKKDTGQWDGPRLIPKRLALVHGMRTASFDSGNPFDATVLPREPDSPYMSDTGEILWDAGGIFETVTPGFVGLTGMLDRFPNHEAGGLTLHRAGGFATLTWIALDAESLMTARRSLITVSTRIQNTGMTWEGTRTIHDDWGSSPTEMESVSISLVLSMRADSIRVYPLDGAGLPAGGPVTVLPGAPDRFHLILNQAQDKTVWWGIENTSAPLPPEVNPPSETELFPNYPNPFNSGTRIPFHLHRKAGVRLEIHNLQGRKIRTLVDTEMPAGRHTASWDLTDDGRNSVAAGIYFIVLHAGDDAQVKKAVHVE